MQSRRTTRLPYLEKGQVVDPARHKGPRCFKHRQAGPARGRCCAAARHQAAHVKQQHKARVVRQPGEALATPKQQQQWQVSSSINNMGRVSTLLAVPSGVALPQQPLQLTFAVLGS